MSKLLDDITAEYKASDGSRESLHRIAKKYGVSHGILSYIMTRERLLAPEAAFKADSLLRNERWATLAEVLFAVYAAGYEDESLRDPNLLEATRRLYEREDCMNDA